MNDAKLYRLVGLWDLLLTLPFALPVVNGRVIDLLGEVHRWISPDREFSAFSAMNLFFVQLFGILAVLWALVRIHRPERFLARYDTAGRMVVALAMVLFWVQGGSLVPVVFALSEVGFGVLQGLTFLKPAAAPKSVSSTKIG